MDGYPQALPGDYAISPPFGAFSAHSHPCFPVGGGRFESASLCLFSGHEWTVTRKHFRAITRFPRLLVLFRRIPILASRLGVGGLKARASAFFPATNGRLPASTSGRLRDFPAFWCFFGAFPSLLPGWGWAV